MLRSVITFFLFLCVTSLSAQGDFRGIIFDQSTNSPIIGATVIIKDTTKVTTTDFDGNFTLNNVSVGTTLVFSYLGYNSQEIVVDENNNNITVYLEPSTSELSEVVLVGYGSQSKKEVTGAVSVLGSKDIEKLNPVRVCLLYTSPSPRD